MSQQFTWEANSQLILTRLDELPEQIGKIFDQLTELDRKINTTQATGRTVFRGMALLFTVLIPTMFTLMVYMLDKRDTAFSILENRVTVLSHKLAKYEMHIEVGKNNNAKYP